MLRYKIDEHLPPFSELLENVQTSRANVARYLGISRQTIRRYEAENAAPRPVMLALFAQTAWAQSKNENAAYRLCDLHASLAACLQAENTLLKAQIASLEKLLAVSDAAGNSPFYRPGESTNGSRTRANG